MEKQKLKVLNLYAGIGGNRKLWTNVDVTAVEIEPDIAKIYQEFFPDDKIIVADAHQYLLEHYKEFDFIWSSPPCPTHSGVNFFLNAQGVIRYPDMSLWQEILFLKHFCKTKYVVENVESYYEPFIKPFNLDRHYFWANFDIPTWNGIKNEKQKISLLNTRASTRRKPEEIIKSLQELHGFDLSKYKISDKRKLLANCVKPELGKHIFQMAFTKKQFTLNNLEVKQEAMQSQARHSSQA